MKIELDQNSPGLRIGAYTQTSISIAGQVYTDSLIIGEGRIISDVLPADVRELQSRHLQPVLEMRPEIVLFGTGPRLRHPNDDIARILFQRNIGMEIMDTGAACRSFNFLLGESRRVVGLLFLADSVSR